MKTTFEFTNNTGQEVIGLMIEFNITRSQIGNIEINPTGLEFHFSISNDVIVNINFTNRSIASNEKLDITINFEGEPLSLAKSKWTIKALAATNLRAITFEAFTSSLDLFRRHQERLSFIETITNPEVKKYHAFFADLDYHTNPPLVAQSPDLSLEEKKANQIYVMPTAGVLVKRVMQRGIAAKTGKVPLVTDMANTTGKEPIEYISKLQLGIYRKHFGDPLDETAFAKAFECFANGELRLTPPKDEYWNSEPDSAFEFLFAEFGWLAIDNGIDTESWELIISALVKSQRLFMRVYQPPKKPYLFSTRTEDPSEKEQVYGPDKFKKENQADEALKAALRIEYTGKPLNEIRLKMGLNILEACPGNFQ